MQNSGVEMKKVIAGLAFSLSLLVPSFSYALDQFQNEQQARKHCPGETVAWLNIPTGIFHYKGQRWYGRTKDGAYVCVKEAVKEGDRATRNGQ